MKKLVLMTFCVSALFANSSLKGSFEKNKHYTCINTHNIQQGQRINIDPKQASKEPFDFSIKADKLITNDNMIFNFKMKKGLVSSYSNPDFMLLLTPNMQIGLVPKKARGSVQYYFSCK